MKQKIKSLMSHHFWRESDKDQVEQLIKLVAQECLDIVDETTCDLEIDGEIHQARGANLVGYAIAKEFGVL